jgi:hypothetical protein
MPKVTELPASAHHVLIFDEDWEYMLGAFGPQSDSRIGVSAGIRAVVHQWVERARKAEGAGGKP